MPDGGPIAYVITSHILPDQVLRLCSRLRIGSPDARIVVHHDDRQTQLDVQCLRSLGVERLEPVSPIEWGAFSHLELHLRCVRLLLERTDAQWLVLLSGQDYPIRPVRDIEQFLYGAGVDAFIEATPCPLPPQGCPYDEFALRYHFHWRGVTPGVAALASRARPLLRVRRMPSGPRLGWPALRSPFRRGLVCHTGADWFSLSRNAGDAIEHFLRVRPDLLGHYQHTLLPTESCFQTVLANDPSLRLSTDHRRYLVFDLPDTRHPRVLGDRDLEPMLASGKDFARKFDPTVDSHVLDEIDRRVHHPQPMSDPGRHRNM